MTAVAEAPDRDATRYAWRVFSVTALGVTLTGLNASTLDVALPVVSRNFSASGTQASWFLLSYMLVNTVLILVFGRLADLVGRRGLYLAGLAVFTVSGLACGFAASPGALIAARVGQGVGAAAIITNTTALLTDVFPARLLSSGLGANIAAVSAAQVAGPVVGGALASSLGWRWVFLFNVPIGLAGLAWASVTLRRTPRAAHRERFDVPGALLSLVTLTGFVVALSHLGEAGLGSPVVVLGGLAFLVGLPAFVLLEARRRDPLLDLGLFAEWARAAAYLSVFLLAVARFSVVLLFALYLQAASGISAFQAGLRVTPVALGIGLASPVAGRLSRRAGPRVPATAGLLLAAAGLLVLALGLSADAPYRLVGAGLLAVGLGTGLFMTPNTASIMTGAPAGRRGAANGVRSMLQNTGFVVSTALTLAIITGPLSPAEQRAAYAGRLSALPGSDLPAFTAACRVALLILAALCVLAAVVSALRPSEVRRPAP